MRIIPSRVRCADRSQAGLGVHNGPHSGPYVLFLSILLFAGCNQSLDVSDPVTAQTGEETPAYPLVVTDAAGRELTFDSPPQRLISVAPKNTELIYAMGLQDRLIAVTEFCNYPPEAQKLEKIGGFSPQTINLELMVALQPDLIVCSDRMHESLIPSWEELGFQVLVLGAESMDQMYDEMELLGKVLGAAEAAEKLSRSLQARVNKISDAVAEIPESDRPRVFYQVWDQPLMGAGPNSFIGEILTLAGGRNILEDVTEPYPYVSHEVVVARNPQVIFAPTTHSSEVIPEKIAQQSGWEGIDASKQKQIYLLDGDQVSRRGPRMVDALETMATRMYPERFDNVVKLPADSGERTQE